jgi:hypothetical protein
MQFCPLTSGGGTPREDGHIVLDLGRTRLGSTANYRRGFQGALMKRRFSKRVLVSSPTLGNYISPVPGVESVGFTDGMPLQEEFNPWVCMS